ncbi:MAG: glycosyltransferase family 10 [Candidatus Babeliales bacterium]
MVRYLLGITFLLQVFLSEADQRIFYINLPEVTFTDTSYPQRDAAYRVFYELAQAAKKLGYEVKEFDYLGSKDYAGAFFINLPNYISPNLIPEKCLFSLWEPPIIAPGYYTTTFYPFRTLYLLDNKIDNNTRFKFFYPQPSLEIEEDIPDFHEKKLCALIATYKFIERPGELFTQRLSVVNFFDSDPQRVQELDVYGIEWPASFKTYKGKVSHKRPVLKNYKFCICYENSNNAPGYVTEKIFDCLVAGCVPIYWGAENITDYVWPNCFIDRRKFKDNQELYNFIKHMKKEEYDQYIENIKAYLKSEMAFLFSMEYFIDLVLSLTVPDYKKELIFNPEQITNLEKAKDYCSFLFKKIG